MERHRVNHNQQNSIRVANTVPLVKFLLMNLHLTILFLQIHIHKAGEPLIEQQLSMLFKAQLYRYSVENQYWHELDMLAQKQ